MFDTLLKNSPPEAGDSGVVTKTFDDVSSKCVTAPFKSRTGLGFLQNIPEGPGPSDHFIRIMQESELSIPLKPGQITFPPDKAPFDTTEERFQRPELYDELPGPADYELKGFAQQLEESLKRHEPAVFNPKLGFGSTAEQRPPQKGKGDINIISLQSCHCLCEKERKWRNLRPKTGNTFGYNGKPPKYPVRKMRQNEILNLKPLYPTLRRLTLNGIYCPCYSRHFKTKFI
jgi:hypothetical protein